MFNMINFREFDIADQFGLFITHTFFFVLACIIIINIFIAILGNVFSVIFEYKHIFQSVNRIIFVKQNYLLFYGWSLWKRKKKAYIFQRDKIILETENKLMKMNI